MEPFEPSARDAIVVLGCRVERNGQLSAAAARRAEGAASAFRTGRAPLIVPAGGKRWGDCVEALAIAEYLTSLGVPREAIRPELSSLTTAENAAYSVALVERLVGRRARLWVVTCSWHLARALESYRWIGVDAAGEGVDPPKGRRAVAWFRCARETASHRLDRLAHARAGTAAKHYAAGHLATCKEPGGRPGAS